MMRKKVKPKRYYLFTRQDHDDFRLDFPHCLIERFIELWNANYSKEYICFKLKIKPVEMALIIIDLSYGDVIKPRSNGLIGTYDSEEERDEACSQ